MGVLSLPPWFVWVHATRLELIFTCIMFGWQLGFGFLTARNAWRQTSAMRRPFRSLFAWMVWGEVITNHVIALFFFLLVIDENIIKPSFGAFLGVAIMWTVGTQLMLQIICNRLAIVEPNPRRAKWIRWGTFFIWGVINISVFIVWIPARMEISPEWMHANEIWDRIEKVIYLLIDLALNVYFIITVKRRLVDGGMKKYDRLVRFNIRIICVSLAMDVILIGCMSMPSILVYCQFHAVCYTVKLNIELALAKLILVVAQEPNTNIRISDNEKSRYEDVLDPYSIRSMRQVETVSAKSEGIGSCMCRCGKCSSSEAVGVQRRKGSAGRDVVSAGDIEADGADDSSISETPMRRATWENEEKDLSVSVNQVRITDSLGAEVMGKTEEFKL